MDLLPIDVENIMLGISMNKIMVNKIYDTIIIGSGPAGLTAAIYTSRARLSTLVIGGIQSGGQLMITTEVENYPGFAEGIMGPQLMLDMKKQAQRMSAEILDRDVESIEDGEIKKVHVGDTIYEAKTIIIATGASSLWLNLDSEKKLMGHGVSGCATCDGAFFRDKVVAVIGGGDSAMEEASFLTRFASKVYVIHRRDQFRASKIMQERVMNNSKIEIIFNNKVLEILGDDTVKGIKIQDVNNNSEKEIVLDGVFVAIGHKPNTDFVKNIMSIDEKGYAVTLSGSDILTEKKGIFVAGDVYDHRYRQAITAAGSGCKAAIEVEKYLQNE